MAEWTVNCSSSLNLDKLLGVLLRDQPLLELRKHLLDVYFHSVNAIIANGAGIGTFGDALYTLQNLIEAVSEMDDNEGTLGIISLTMKNKTLRRQSLSGDCRHLTYIPQQIMLNG